MLNFLLPDVFESSQQFDEWFNPNDQVQVSCPRVSVVNRIAIQTYPSFMSRVISAA